MKDLGQIAKTIAKYEPVKILARGDPVFVNEAEDLRAVKFNFNGWGNEQAHSLDNRVAEAMADLAGVELVTSSTSSLVLECGEGSRSMEALLGLRKIIWLPGIAGKDVADGHTDFFACFAKPVPWKLSLFPSKVRTKSEDCAAGNAQSLCP
ncbi:aguA, partial [Symbiodinium natans]